MVMKKFYLKPDSRFVDINLNNPILDDEPAQSEQGNITRVWEEGSDRLPSAHSVWGEEEQQDH